MEFGPLDISRPLALLALWYRRARTRAQLARLDAAALCDIGISEIERRAECARWFWQGTES